jgi:hypothetical protein
MKQFSQLMAAGIVMLVVAGPAAGQSKDLGRLDKAPPAATATAAPTATAAAPGAGVAAQNAGMSVTYVPPDRKSPRSRIGASTRGTMDGTLMIEALAPEDHVGLTAVSQPVLYGYLSPAGKRRVEFTIDNHDLGASRGPLLEVTLNLDRPAGIFALDLRDFGVRLSPGVDYRWTIAVIVDPDQRSGDPMASGLIRYEKPAGNFAATASRLKGDARMRAYAALGYWYDALKAVSEGSDRPPAWHQRRAELLEQVDLAGLAALDRSSVPVR